jgi:hypothetical protein
LDLHEDFGAAVVDVKIIEKPLLKLRRVEGSGDRAAPNLSVVG